MTDQPGLHLAVPDPARTHLTMRLAAAEQELAAISTAQEAQQLADKAAAAAEFARRVKLGNASINHATVIRVLAERRMAELVDEGQAARQIATQADNPGSYTGVQDSDTRKPSPLPDLGIDRRRLNEARKLGRDYTDDDIRDLAETASGADRQLSRNALLKSNARLMRSSETNEWYTPAPYLEAARTVLGAIDLDPASCAAANASVRAARFYSKEDDGLSQPWKGRIWLNPPYGRIAGGFVARFAETYRAGDMSAGIALINAHSIDTIWFRPLWDAVLCFTYQRIDFIGATGRPQGSTHGSVFAYLGPDPARFAAGFAPFGAVVRRWPL